MKKVQLADRLGNMETRKVGFSWLHFFFGPIYSMARGRIFFGILEALFIFYFTPIPGMQFIANLFDALKFIPVSYLEFIKKLVMLFRLGHYYILGILFTILCHFVVSYYIDSYILKKHMKKKQLLPVDEKDARILIRYHVAKEKIALASSFDMRTTNSYKMAEENWYINNQSRINKKGPSYDSRSQIKGTGSTQKIKIQLEQLQNSFHLGLISKEEYEKRFKELMGD